MIQKQKKLRGSVLVFTLLVMTILLSAALSSAGIVITGKNSSRATEKSALAFQVADGAAENVLKRIYKDNDNTLSQLASNLYASNGGGNAPTCQTGGVITGSLPGGSGVYSVSFRDNNDDPLQCSGAGYSTYDEWRTKLVRIVASGSYAGATRAIDVTVKPPTCTDATVDDADGNTYDTVAIGNQCWMKQNMRVGSEIPTGTAQTNNVPTNIVEYYCYNNASGNCNNPHLPGTEADGGLYTWDEAMGYVTTEGAQGICPDGWHIPSDSDWYELEHYLDSTINDPNAVSWRGSTAGIQMKAGGSSGLEFNLTGYRNSGSFSQRDIDGYFWSSSLSSPGVAWFRGLRNVENGSWRGTGAATGAIQEAVRCVKD